MKLKKIKVEEYLKHITTMPIIEPKRQTIEKRLKVKKQNKFFS